MLQAPLREKKNANSKAWGGSAQQETGMKLLAMMDEESPGEGTAVQDLRAKRDEWPSMTRAHQSLCDVGKNKSEPHSVLRGGEGTMMCCCLTQRSSWVGDGWCSRRMKPQ